MANFPHRHLKLPKNRIELRFQGSGRGKFDRRFDINRKKHAAKLLHDLQSIKGIYENELEERIKEELSLDFGLILNIESAPGFPLKIDSLEKGPTSKYDGIALLNVKYRETAEGTITSAAIMVPFGQLDSLVKKVSAYANPEKDTTNKDGIKSPKNADLISNIEKIGVAALEALWTEKEPIPHDNNSIWWEMWVSRAPRAANKGQTWIELFDVTRKKLGLKVNQFRLRLPDNEIVLVKATKQQLESSVDLLNTLTEIRKVRPCRLDLTDLTGPEQVEWIHEALSRIKLPEIDAPAVCLLDTGVNREHPLIKKILTDTDLDTIMPEIGAADHPNPGDAHGTPMAGIAAYDDLRNLMLSSSDWKQEHWLESVKIVHNGDEHDPENYGAVTNEAIVKPETKKPERLRAYCLAITQDGDWQGQPSSWSAGIDASAAGTGEENNPKRVILISAGNNRNFLDYVYPQTNKNQTIENPAQAWNGITVGAMTQKTTITESDDESQRSRAIAGNDMLSPLSRTSIKWEPRWPIKPDIVMEGGNLGQSESGEISEFDSLYPISTASNFLAKPLCCMNGTSAAVASAARLQAILMAKYSSYWPETYRGLLVHSARWKQKMLGGLDPHRSGNHGELQQILRMYGYGTPDEARLYGSGESGVTMIIEDEIQPYDPGSDAGKAKLGYFNLHDLPWPKDVFENNREVELTLKVTLSYFIDPNPGSRCWTKSQKYKYASHLLRFTFKRSTEDDETFKRALEKQIVEENELEQEEATQSQRSPSDSRWAVGPKLRGKSGSLVQDIWKGSPADLSEMDKVAIYPGKGWFATRKFSEDHEFYNCHKRKVRYSLIVSIDAEQEIGLYTSISNTIGISV